MEDTERMRWLIGVVVVFLVAFVLKSGLVVFGAAAFAAVFGMSRYASREGLTRVTAERETGDAEIEVGQSVSVRVRVVNEGRAPMPWLLLEDLVPEDALRQ